MLTCDEARALGRNACIQKIGIEFYEKYRTSATIAYGDFSEEGVVFCYVGVDDQPMEDTPSEPLILVWLQGHAACTSFNIIQFYVT